MTVLEHYSALGLQTYGKEQDDPSYVVRRPVYKYEPVLNLHRIELPSLFGRLIRDDLDRDDPNLFDSELDEVLAKLGPQIWPVPGSASRDHLKEPEAGTEYPAELVYPRDRTKLKEHLRGAVICKRKFRPGTDIEALVQKRGKKERRRRLNPAQSAPTTPLRQSRASQLRKVSSTVPRRRKSPDISGSSASETDEGPTGTRTRRQTLTDRSYAEARQVQLRLYRLDTVSEEVVWPLGSINLSGDGTSDECFSRICGVIDGDCNWLTFRLPEDISHQKEVRVVRGSRGVEAVFQHVLYLFQKAPRFPADIRRIVEVEVGLDADF